MGQIIKDLPLPRKNVANNAKHHPLTTIARSHGGLPVLASSFLSLYPKQQKSQKIINHSLNIINRIATITS
jgi:hypothetical protein